MQQLKQAKLMLIWIANTKDLKEFKFRARLKTWKKNTMMNTTLLLEEKLNL